MAASTLSHEDEEGGTAILNPEIPKYTYQWMYRKSRALHSAAVLAALRRSSCSACAKYSDPAGGKKQVDTQVRPTKDPNSV